MKKAVLSHRIYLTKTDQLMVSLKEALYYKIPQQGIDVPPLIIYDVTTVTDRVVSIPIGRLDLIPDDYTIVDKRVLVPHEFPEINGTLRDTQQEVYDATEDSCIINAKPGWGKTYTAIAIAVKLGQKVLIITPTVIIRKMWEEEIFKLLDMKPGIIGSGNLEFDHPICVGNIQTVRKHALTLGTKFGTVIIDEAHHCPANTFKDTLGASKARYKIGLSGTLGRKDGKDILIYDYISKTVFKPIQDNVAVPEVMVVDTNFELSCTPTSIWANMLNDLADDVNYIELVATLAGTQAALGHKVLTLSDRVEFLQICTELSENAICVVGTANGKDVEVLERKEIIRRIVLDINMIFATTSIYKEGVDVPPLSCIVLATPINNEHLLEQIIGRVTRPYKGKKQPLIIDIKMKGHTGIKQFNTRLGHYLQQGYRIRYV